ncbi:hypothetical protein [Bernardetia sp.]|uniref:hypothetical protein n=1 Tax=Bernardetia sp. TaxID=1937974 RepID=UPI0025C39686|nr:hypothetical protein [Bernardetia sp.]
MKLISFVFPLVFVFSFLLKETALSQTLTDQEQINFYLENLNNQEFDIEDYEEQYFDGKVIYSSDSLLKLFTFTGDAHFAYFTSISKSYLHVLDTNAELIEIRGGDYGNVVEIHNLSKNKQQRNYLILENKEEKVSSVYYISSVTASWLIIENKSSRFGRIYKADKKLSYSTPKYDLDNTLEINVYYNIKDKKLIFEYDLLSEVKSEEEPSHFMRIVYEWKGNGFEFLKKEKLSY